MVTPALAIQHMFATGSRSSLAVARNAPRMSGAARFVRTRRGLALFDEQGRSIGTVDFPQGEPKFGTAEETLLLQRS
jgi:hypothetical protein